MELEFEKYCVVDGSPTTVLPSPRRLSNVEKRKFKRQPNCANDPLNQNPNLYDISSSISQSTSCKSSPCSENSEMLKRGSVYQNSKELHEAKKIGIFDWVYSSDEESSLVELDKFSFMSQNNEPNASVGKQRIEIRPEFLDITFPSVSKRIGGVSSDGFLEISLDSFGTSNDCNETEEDSCSLAIYMSLSAQDSPCQSENEWSESSSKSRISHLGSVTQNGVIKTAQKSLFGNLSKTWSAQCDSQILCSPAHLHGLLKRGTKREFPFYEFSMKLTGEILVAKIWKMENSSNWVYAFHKKERNNSTRWGFKDSNRESRTIAQMQVSSYISTEPNINKAYNKSVVMEFVLNQSLESAAVVIEVPCEKRESLKSNRGNTSIDELVLNLNDRCNIDKRMNTAKVNVITPLGNHSLPENKSCCPSPLLERWRYGGGCDCGGWDMGCPIVVSGNSNIQYYDERIVLDNQHPFELYMQGIKEKTPAFTMSVIKEGQYEVDFHAHLTALQAFSICVAVLHSMETNTRVKHEREKQVAHYDSPRVNKGDEVKCSTEEEKPPSSLVVNPPFSPIARA